MWQAKSLCKSLQFKNQQGTIKSIKHKEATIDDLIANVSFNPEIDTYTSSNDNEKVEAKLVTFSPHPDPRQAKDISNACRTRLRNYDDSGVTTFLEGPKHLQNIGLPERNLISFKNVHDMRIVQVLPNMSRLAANYIHSRGKIYKTSTIHM